MEKKLDGNYTRILRAKSRNNVFSLKGCEEILNTKIFEMLC